MDTKRIEALRAEMQGKYRMESVSVGTLSCLLDALLAPAASEPAQEPEPCVFGQESDCSCSKHRCPKCSGPGSSRTLPCVDCAQEPERCGCGWRYAATREEGCVPGDCSMRSNRGSVTPAPASLTVGDRVVWGRGTGKVIDPGPFAYVRLGKHEHFLPLADLRRVEPEKDDTPARGESPEAPDQHVGANIRGRCPACGFSSLFRWTAGYVTCSFLDCPDPGAAAKLMERDHAADQRELDDLRARLAAAERNMNEHIADKHRILREYEAQAQVLRQKLTAAEREIAAWERCAGIVVMAADGCDPDDRTPDALPRLVAGRITREEKRAEAAERERDDLVRQINEACAATECCSTLAEMRDTVIEGSHRLVKLERERDEARAELAENGTTLCCAYCGWIVTGITDPEQRRDAVVEHFLDCPKAPYAKMAFALQMGAICDEHIGVHQSACPICAARDRTRELTESLIQAANWQKRAEAAERRVEELTAELLNLRHTLDAALWRADRCERENLTLRVAVYQAHTATSEISRAIEAAGCSPALTAAINAVTRQRDALAATLAKGEPTNG